MEYLEMYAEFFEGFYNSVWSICPETDEDLFHINEERKERGYPELDESHQVDIFYDNESYEISVSESVVRDISSRLKDYVSDVSFVFVDSPKYYNYTNDKIVFKGSFTPENITNINTFLVNHSDDFKEFIKDNFSDRPGFMSYYPNDSTEFLEDWINNYIKRSFVLGFIYRIELMGDEHCDTSLSCELYNVIETPLPQISNFEEMVNLDIED